MWDIKKELIPITLINAFNDGKPVDGYLYKDRFIMKDLGQMNERLLDMLLIDINHNIMDVIDREVPNLKVCSVPNDGVTIGEWFYIKEE